MRHQIGKRQTIDPLFEDLAKATRGQLITTINTDIEDATNLIDSGISVIKVPVGPQCVIPQSVVVRDEEMTRM